MSEQHRLSDLLIRRQQLLEDGLAASAEELCAECPEMLDELRAQISALQSMEAFLGVSLRTAATGTENARAATDDTGLKDDSTIDSRGSGPLHGAKRPGEFVAGYELLGELGRGGMGVVYRARQHGLKRLVALKMILAGRYAHREHLARFAKEAEAVARLQHPHIVQIYEIGEHEGLPFFSLEYIAGGSLASRLDGTPLPPNQAAELVQTLARAIHVAHEHGIVHRDLKPANVLLQPVEGLSADPTGASKTAEIASFTPKITDFGLAKQLDAENTLTQSDAIMGTPSYMAPEQAAGLASSVGPLSDVYALGAILYELVTGRPPFKGSTLLDTLEQVRTQEPVTPRQLVTKLPRDLETICVKCLQKDPERRYSNAVALADDLGRFLRREPIRARPVHALERAARWCSRNPKIATLAASLALALVIGSAAVFSQWHAAQSNLARAERNFRKAKMTVDDFFTTVSREELLNEPSMQPLRKKLLQRALTYYQDFVRERGNDPTLRNDLSAALFNLAHITSETGSATEALPLLEQAKAIQEETVRTNPSLENRVALGRIYHNLGIAYQETGQTDLGRKEFERSLAVRETLAREDPSRVELQADVGRILRKLGYMSCATGQTAEGQRLLRESAAILERSLAQSPKESLIYAYLAETYSAQSEFVPFVESVALGEKVVSLREQALSLRPSSLQVQFELATAHRDLGLILRDHEPTRGLEQLEKSMQLFERLHERSPEVRDYQFSLASNLDQVAYTRHQNKEAAPAALTAALSLYERAQELCEPLLRENPGNFDSARLLATIMNGIALVQRDMNRPAESLAAFAKAVELQQLVVKQDPTQINARRDLAGTHHNIGRLHESCASWDEALTAYAASRSLRQDLVNANPDVLDFRTDLGLSDLSIGSVHFQAGQLEEAVGDYAEAYRTFRDLYRSSPSTPLFRSVLSDVLGNQRTLFHNLKRPADAAAVARARIDLWPNQPNELFNAARELALCVALTASASGKDHPEPERFGDEAMDALRRAVAAGWKNVAQLKSLALSPLHDRSDFQQLVAELEAGTRE